MENQSLASLGTLPAIQPKEETLVLGAGEIGMSLRNVLESGYSVTIRDKEALNDPDQHFRVINITYPFSNKFIDITTEYIKKYTPEVVIVHSTVPVGTTRKLGPVAVHSPVIGKHPHLEQSIRTFVKFVGGIDVFTVFNAVDFLERAGIKPFVLSTCETTEYAKLACTRRYGMAIAEMKETARECNELGIPFHEAYTIWNNEYNQGYQKMSMGQFTRPVLFPMEGGIGGHCVIPNLELLPSLLAEWLKGRNDFYKNEQNLAARAFKHFHREDRGGVCDPQPRMDRKGSSHRKSSKDSSDGVPPGRSNAGG